MAELVDASVSKTDEVTLVPVRPRPRVLQQGIDFEVSQFLVFLLAVVINRIIYRNKIKKA